MVKPSSVALRDLDEPAVEELVQPSNLSSQEIISPETTDANNTITENLRYLQNIRNAQLRANIRVSDWKRYKKVSRIS